MKKILCFTTILLLVITTVQAESQKTILLSIPKCGTYLAAKATSLITKRKKISCSKNFLAIDQQILEAVDEKIFFETHAIASDQNINKLNKFDWKGLFIYRDPRDQIISNMFYIYEQQAQAWPHLARLQQDSFIEKMLTDMSSLYGPPAWQDPILLQLKGIDTFYNLYMPWLKNQNVYTTTFEKLVGSKGGGSDELQKQEVKNIANHLNISLTNKEINNICEKLFGDTGTFRKGTIGTWKHYFNNEHIKIAKELIGDLLIKLNYEENLNW